MKRLQRARITIGFLYERGERKRGETESGEKKARRYREETQARFPARIRCFSSQTFFSSRQDVDVGETLSESARGALDARPTVAPVVPFPSARRLIDSFGGRF